MFAAAGGAQPTTANFGMHIGIAVTAHPPFHSRKNLASVKLPVMATQKKSDNRYKKSQQLFERALQLMPGGVSSPARSFKSVGLEPVFIKSGQGAYLTDVDGNSYMDLVMSYGPLIAGHAHPAVRAAMAKQMSRGTSFGCCTPGEVDLAQMISDAMGSNSKVRFVNSGTEAVMSAIRLARGATGRRLIIKIVGGYHGHVDALLVQAGSGATTHGNPSSPGIPAGVVENTLLMGFNDVAAAREQFNLHGWEIAALIIEPVLGNIGVVNPEPGYLAELRRLCDQHGALLIFDEVMTGFRVAWGGVQSQEAVRPDITCLGKIIGGGLPVGAYVARPALMDHISPAGPIYQAGTLSGNPLSMAAGAATLRLLQAPGAYGQLELLAARLQEGLVGAAAKTGVPLAVQRRGSMLTPFFLPGAAPAAGQSINNYAQALSCNTQAYAVFFKQMLDAGVMLPPSQFEAWFVSLVHTSADIDSIVEKARVALAVVQAGMGDK